MTPGPAKRVKVLFPMPLAKAYDYLARGDLRAGDWVEAPFGGRLAVGVVWPGALDEVPAEKLKSVATRLGAPPLSSAVIDFVGWVAEYTMHPLGACLRLVMRSGDALRPPSGATSYIPSGQAPARMTEARQAALSAFAGAPLTVRRIAELAGVSEAVVRGLVGSGALKAISVDPDPPFDAPDPLKPGVALSPEQARAARALIAATGRGGATLLDGVTGSGKTEVYLEAVADALQRDAASQVLILLPEISLTLPFLKRVEARFGAEPAAWHSDLTGAARRRVWRRVCDGSARLVIGARSALFLPYKNLSMIVVDEEHDAAYKQEEGVIYQARDMAVARGARAGFPVILASATPSLESVVNVEQGRYELVRLTARFGSAALPKVALVDMRRDGPEDGRWLAPRLVDAVNARLTAGEQSLLFINRRGYAPLTLCRKCGHRMKSPHADAWLVEHRFENRLVCHHTGFSMPKPPACPNCNAVGSLAACGPGVERVAEEAQALWPNARRAVLSSDMVQSPVHMRAVLEAMEAGEVDILIATQMVAKGHHFPNLTLVGVVDADMGLTGGDLRAAERTYQLLSQVAGRAGRAERKGEALLQTYIPHAAVFSALERGDRDAFLEAESEGRSALAYPPYGRLATVTLKSKDERRLKECASAHKGALFNADGVIVFGPAPAPIYRIRGEARIRFLVKTRRDINIQAFIASWTERVRPPAAVRRVIDIDPYSLA
ncbi:MAG: primosomal protein N' [Parvularculaceae bacterium]|nr:primosomal protein N' [Parvularculaceae bacterium]